MDSIEGYHTRDDRASRRQLNCEEKINLRAHHEQWVRIWQEKEAKELAKPFVKKGLHLQLRAVKAIKIWEGMKEGFREASNQFYHRHAV